MVQLVITRGKVKKVIKTTKNHVWFIKKKTHKGHYITKKTCELETGDIFREKTRYEKQNVVACKIGIQHGIVYGDGTYDKAKNHCRVHLVDSKQELLKYFTTGTACTAGKYNQTVIYGLPNTWKEIPSIDNNIEYLYGFLIGLFATDGNNNGNSHTISNTNIELLKLVRDICSLVGIKTGDIRLTRETNPFTGEYAPLYEIHLCSENITPDFLLRTDHLQNHNRSPKKLYWKVDEIIETGKIEDVWCVEEPETHTFTLSNSILTHNCSFMAMDDVKKFSELIFVLMLGTGAGISVERKYVSKLPKVNTKIDIIHKNYSPVPKRQRKEHTELIEKSKDVLEIVIGDSKFGWSKAVDMYFEIVTSKQYSDVDFVLLNYDNVRPAGERLKTFGGFASGHVALQVMFEKINKLIKAKVKNLPEIQWHNLKPVDCLDICTIIAENVVSGGTRRSAEIMFCDADEKEVIEAKGNIYYQNDSGAWVTNKEIEHRTLSNNTVLYKARPTREELHNHFQKMILSGEPAIGNFEEMLRRRADVQGGNPCFEILLRDRGVCNLTEVNVNAFVREDGTLDREGLLRAQELSAKMGYRMATIELELHEWNLTNVEDRLTGCSITGVMDALNALGYDREQTATLLRELRETAVNSANGLADFLHMNRPKLVTAIKPSGCWTKEFTRVTDKGILFIDEIEETHNKVGFIPVENDITVHGDKVSNVYINDIKDILQLKLKNGRLLKITKEHPMSIDGDWVMAKDIKIGDKIDYSLGNYKSINHSRFVDLDVSNEHNNTIEYRLPKEMNEDLAWLIGAYYANGCFTTKERIKYTTNNIKVHKKVQSIWRKYFGIDTKIVKCSEGREAWEQSFKSVRIYRWFELNGIAKKEFDKIPLIVRKSSYIDILAFIAGYADNDGCFAAKTFSIDTHNEVFARHLQEVGEAVGLSLSLSINKARSNSYSKKFMYKTHCSRSFSNKGSLDIINRFSVKAKDKPIETGAIFSENPYVVKEIIELKEQQTYDIEVENSHWYYQGCLKSHNTISQLPTVSSGMHYSHSPYFIRRVRVGINDPIVPAMTEMGFKYIEESMSKVVFEFPVRAPEGKTKYDVSAIEQLEMYKLFMENYVQHNASNTIHVRPHEWADVEEWVYNNWDSMVGVTFLSLDDSFYPLMPYESITKEQYEEMVARTPKFNPAILTKYENFDEEEQELEADCDSGACPVR